MFDIISIGTATKDIFLKSPFFKVLRDPVHLKKIGLITGQAECFALGGKIEVSELIITTGGGATNTATTFSRQGLKTAALIRIGRDESGRSILKELSKEKIVPLTVYDKNQITANSVILLSSSGERTILIYRGAAENLKTKEIPFKRLKSRWAYVSGEMPLLTAQKIFDYFDKNQISIAFNPSKYFLDLGMGRLKPLLNKSRVVVLNQEEAAYLTKIDYRKENEIFKKLDGVIKGLAVMTKGGEGVLVSDGKIVYSAGIFRGKLVDRLGAGDAFTSGFVTGLMRHRLANMKHQVFNEEQIKYAIRLGTANATSVIEHIGAKQGILKKSEFKKLKRWQNLPIKIRKI